MGIAQQGRCCVLVQAMVVLLTVLVRTSVVDAQHVWEYLARNNSTSR